MIDRLLTDRVKGLKPYVAGATKEEIAGRHGLKAKDVIKLASNENPFGPSPKAIEAIRRYAPHVNLYPEDHPRELIKGISEYLGLPSDQVVVGGNGADEIMELMIKLVISQGDKVILHQPTFPYYEILTRIYGGTPRNVPMGQGYTFPVDHMLKEGANARLAIMCSPNNPTGSIISEKDLRAVLESGVLVMLDEAYVEFAERSHTHLVGEYENLMVLRTFSKAFGLAGLRVGYGVGSADLIKELLKIKPPHNVNLLAQKAAMAALQDLQYMQNGVKHIIKMRADMLTKLSDIPGLKAYPSEANFLLVSLEKGKGRTTVQELEKRGIIVRGCAGFGLEDSVRVSIGTEDENTAFLSAFRDVLG